MTIEEITARKGAQKSSGIPNEVLVLLNTGRIPTVNLTEWLAIDHLQLVKNTLPAMGIDSATVKKAAAKIAEMKKPTTMNTIKHVGAFLCEKYANTPQYAMLFEQLSTHLSDSVRCYACYFMALHPSISLADKLKQLLPLVGATIILEFAKLFGWQCDQR